MEKLIEMLKIFKNDDIRKNQMRHNEIQLAKKELENAWTIFNEVTDSAYIDIAILKLNLAKRRFEVLLEEAKKDSLYLEV